MAIHTHENRKTLMPFMVILPMKVAKPDFTIAMTAFLAIHTHKNRKTDGLYGRPYLWTSQNSNGLYGYPKPWKLQNTVGLYGYPYSWKSQDTDDLYGYPFPWKHWRPLWPSISMKIAKLMTLMVIHTHENRKTLMPFIIILPILTLLLLWWPLWPSIPMKIAKLMTFMAIHTRENRKTDDLNHSYS